MSRPPRLYRPTGNDRLNALFNILLYDLPGNASGQRCDAGSHAPASVVISCRLISPTTSFLAVGRRKYGFRPATKYRTDRQREI